MTEGAARLVDEVFPREPVRMWVLSMPYRVRYHLARMPKLKREVLAIFIRELTLILRRLASCPRGKIGAVTVVQRFGSALNLNVHFHTLAIDGVYDRGEFHKAATPAQEDLDALASTLRNRILSLLVTRNCIPDLDEGLTADEPEAEAPTLFEMMQAASIREWIGLSGDLTKVTTLGGAETDEWRYVRGPLCGERDGFNVQAAVRIPASDRGALEQLCRYVLRPPFAADRFKLQPDGNIVYELRRPRHDGTTALLLKPLELLEKMAALIPPPRAHQTHYHGVLAPHAKVRRDVVPNRKDALCEGCAKGKGQVSADWATMLRRTFGIDALKCPECGGRLKFMATIEDPEVIKKILGSMNLAQEPPPLWPARAPPAPSGVEGPERLPWDESA